jgi:hypothetical protein
MAVRFSIIPPPPLDHCTTSRYLCDGLQTSCGGLQTSCGGLQTSCGGLQNDVDSGSECYGCSVSTRDKIRLPRGSSMPWIRHLSFANNRRSFTNVGTCLPTFTNNRRMFENDPCLQNTSNIDVRLISPAHKANLELAQSHQIGCHH